MKSVSVREMKANWSEIEEQVKNGETFEVLNRGKPTVRIIAAEPKKMIKWVDHLADAIKVEGETTTETLMRDRESKW